MSDSATYADAAEPYFALGWNPLPVLGPGKGKTPTGFSGYEGKLVTAGDVARWVKDHPGAGTCLRLVDTIGLDLDAYDTVKAAGDSWDALRERLGTLPATWAASSRFGEGWDGQSGIRLYRLPDAYRERQRERVWKGNLGPGIDIIRFAHRQVNCWPKIHPSLQTAYQWLSEATGEIVGGVIPVSPMDLPGLPPAWCEELLKPLAGQVATQRRAAKAAKGTSDQHLAWWTPGEPCAATHNALYELLADLRGSRHDTAVLGMLRLTRLGEQGHQGTATALAELRAGFIAELTDHPDTSRTEPPEAEWARAEAGIEAQILLQGLTPHAAKGCCGPRRATMGGEQVPDRDADGLWALSSELGLLREFALARMAAPEAVLLIVLLRILQIVPPHVCTPALIGGRGALNSLLALAGPSGAGKGTAERAAEAAVRLHGEVHTAALGSGEGIAHQYKRRTKKGELETVRDAVLFSAAEVQGLHALSSRNGSTLEDQLRKTFSGEELSFAYADATRRLPMQSHTYRFGLVVGVQPEHAGILLDQAAGGTPQRFVWAKVTDPAISENPPAEPEPLDLPALDWSIDPAGPLDWREFGLCEEAVSTIRKAHVARQQDRGDALDGHALFARVKLGAAVAVLHSRQEVTSWDWKISGLLMARSDRTRAEMQRVLRVESAKRSRAAAEGHGREALTVEEMKQASLLKGAQQAVRKALERGEGATTRKAAKDAAGLRYRPYLDEALAEMQASGEIRQEARRWILVAT